MTPFLKRYLLNLTVMLAALLIALLLAEIGFRMWAGWKQGQADPVVRMGPIVRPSADEDLVYEYIPGPPHTNSAGMRGPECTMDKPANTIRIAGIGDSVMAADLYKPEESFIYRLGDLLNAEATSPTRFATPNFSVGGYNMYQNASVLKKKAFAYDPDFIVLGIVINDTERPVYYQVRDRNGKVSLRDRYQDEKRWPFSDGIDLAHRPWWSHSAMARFVHFRATRKSRFVGGFKYMQGALNDIAATCRERNVPVLAVVFTEFAELGQEDARAEWHDIVRKACRDAGLPLLEMYPRIMRHLEENKIASYQKYWSSPLDAHPNAEGHRLIARFIFERLREMALLEMKPDRPM